MSFYIRELERWDKAIEEAERKTYPSPVAYYQSIGLLKAERGYVLGCLMMEIENDPSLLTDYQNYVRLKE